MNKKKDMVLANYKKEHVMNFFRKIQNRIKNGKPVDSMHQEEPCSEKTDLPSPLSIALLFILALEAIAVVIMEGFVIFYHTMLFSSCQFTLPSLGLQQVDFIYHGTMVFLPIYQFFLYLDLLRQRNVLHMVTLFLFGILMVIYTGVQTIQHMGLEQVGCHLVAQEANITTLPNSTSVTSSSNKLKMAAIIYNGTEDDFFQDGLDTFVSNMQPFEYTILVLVPLCFLAMLAGSIKLYHLFKWNHFKSHTFTDIRLRNTLIAWALLCAILKVDFFFVFAYGAQLIPSVLIGYTDVFAFESLVVFAVGLVGFLLAFYAIRYEHTKSLCVFSTLAFVSIGYFGYRLFTFGIPRNVDHDPYKLTRYNLLYTTLVLTLLMIITLCTSIVCITNLSIKNIHILQSFHCICPSCHAYSSDQRPGLKKETDEVSVYQSLLSQHEHDQGKTTAS